TEAGGIQVVANDDDGNQRDDSRDHAHDENEQRIAERAHPEAARHIRRRSAWRRGFVLQDAHSIHASAQRPPSIPVDTLRKPCLTSRPSDLAPTPSNAPTAVR